MKLEDIKCIGILGAGVMGGGIAQSAILAGYKVIVRDLKDEICDKAKDTIINGRFGIKGVPIDPIDDSVAHHIAGHGQVVV